MQKSNKRKDNLKQLLTVKNETHTSADLYFYGDIVSDWCGAWDDSDQYPESVRNFLKEQNNKNLNIYINSAGGSVFAGLAIYNMLKRHNGFKTVYVDGIAASIASVIALAGDRIVVPSNAFLMIHKPWAICEGNAEDFLKMATDLDSIETGIMNIYKEHLVDGADIAELQKMVDAETWLNGEEASKYFDIEVVAAKEYAAKLTDTMTSYENIPKEIINLAGSAANHPTEKSCDLPGIPFQSPELRRVPTRVSGDPSCAILDANWPARPRAANWPVGPRAANWPVGPRAADWPVGPRAADWTVGPRAAEKITRLTIQAISKGV